MKPRIAILDYGVGNLRSVRRGLESEGAEAVVTNDGNVLFDSDALVLPGVGAFCDAMDDLRAFEDDITSYVEDRPLLGICLGLQLLFTESEEDGLHEGLGLLRGRVIRLPDTVKIPQMGWNSTEIKRESRLLRGLRSGEFLYYVHSYYAVPEDDVTTATTTYGVEVPAVVEKDNIYATQFHPEKSGRTGLKLLKNFVDIAGD
ncbi:MAG: imidazole glycerol phosphate synthase subunit HisH [Candidatus Hydrothermarchaeaceae archaeon]